MSFEDVDTTFPEDGWLLTEANVAQLATPKGQVLAGKGQTVICHNGSNVWLLKSFLALKTPLAQDITPPDLGSFVVKQVLFDPFSTSTAVGAYVLASDGTNSAVWHTSNCAAVFPVWTQGAVVSGTYTVIRAGNAAGAVLIYAPDNNTVIVTDTYDFTVSNQGFTATGWDGSGYTGSYVAGVGWQKTATHPIDCQGVAAYLPVSAGTLFTELYVEWTDTGVAGGSCGGNFADGILGTALDGTGVLQLCHGTSSPTGPCSFSQSGATYLVIAASTYLGTITITKLRVKRQTAGSGAIIRYSSDNGATFGGEVSVGTSPGSVGGMDTQLAGTVSYAAVAGAVKKASTLGGSYSAFISTTGANPVCCVVPWYTRNSTTVKNTTGSTPDVLVALDAADSDGGSLYWVSGAGTKTSITPTAGMTFADANCITTSYGTYIAVIGTVSGTKKLYTSFNGGTSWTFRENLTAPAVFVRGRRRDSSALRSKAQLYLNNNGKMEYSSYYGRNGMFVRQTPANDIVGFDIWDG